MHKHKNNYDINNMDWSYEHAFFYHYVEYKTIESVLTEQLDLPQLRWWFFNNSKCDFKVIILVGMW